MADVQNQNNILLGTGRQTVGYDIAKKISRWVCGSSTSVMPIWWTWYKSVDTVDYNLSIISQS
jgi:hypothetical protein